MTKRLATAVLMISAIGWGQTKQPALVAPAAAGAAAKAQTSKDLHLQEVDLTDSERKDLEIQRLKGENLRLQIQQVQTQVEQQFHFRDQTANLTKENQALAATLAKAHNLDFQKYRLDEQKKAFVPIEEPK